MPIGQYLENEGIWISSGKMLNTDYVHKFGAVPSMSINNTGTIWDVNDTLYPWSAFNTPGVLTIPAVNASDNGNKVEVLGLDENYNKVSEEFTLSSSGTVTGTKIFSRVYRAYFFNTTTNIGNINIQRAGTTVARITANKAQTLMAVYTVPYGYNAFITQGIASIQAGGDATIDMFIRYHGQSSFRIGHSAELTSGASYNYKFTIPPLIPEKSDIDIRASVRSNNARVTAAFDVILVKARP
jgi:hypothetical protein